MMRPATDSVVPGPADQPAGNAPAVAAWLIVCSLLVFAIVVVGGVTRLTRSGLSITEWQPIAGVLPPLSDAQWLETFDKYRLTPEYRQVNRGMSLAEFKGIFWWEYAHRLLGRLVGVVFLLPYLYFLLRRKIPAGYAGPLAGIFVLGALQGGLGWFMVMSGLVDDPRVSHFRLTAHLGLALVIFGAMLWTALSLLAEARPDRPAHPARTRAFAAVALVFLMILSGGFVAGIRAGYAYNTFPLMQGKLVPPEILMLEPWWTNLFWNMATVQFVHRTLAWVLAIVIPLLWWQIRRAGAAPARAQALAGWLVAVLGVQVALGIATLVLVVPIPLAALHQAGAVAVFGLALAVAHALR